MRTMTPEAQATAPAITGGLCPRSALYVRVSTREQTTDTQERQLREWAERLGLEVVQVYRETASGARADRAQLAAVLAAAHRREFDVLLVWALDRLKAAKGSPPCSGT